MPNFREGTGKGVTTMVRSRRVHPGIRKLLHDCASVLLDVDKLCIDCADIECGMTDENIGAFFVEITE